MPHITTCPICGRCYEESSEEQANSPERQCMTCYTELMRYGKEKKNIVTKHLQLIGKGGPHAGKAYF